MPVRPGAVNLQTAPDTKLRPGTQTSVISPAFGLVLSGDGRETAGCIAD